MNKITSLIRRPYFYITAILIAVAAISFIAIRMSGNTAEAEPILVAKGSVISQVSVTGTTLSVDSASLSFRQSGTIDRVFVSVGDSVSEGQVLARLEIAEKAADVEQYEASLAAETARLNKLKSGTRPEELAVEAAKVENAERAFLDALYALRDAIRSAYTQADNAVYNSADALMSNPKAAYPTFIYNVDSQLESDITNGRIEVGALLPSWSAIIDTLPPKPDRSSADVLFATAIDSKANVEKVGDFLDDMSQAVNSLTPSSSLTQTSIDAHKSSISTARTTLNTQASGISTAREKARTALSSLLLAERQYELAKAGPTADEVAASEAAVRQAASRLSAARVALAKMYLTAPFPGVVTKMDAKRGENVAANSPIASLMTLNRLEIEANVSEVDIGSISLGDRVTVDFDAIPGEKFDAVVTSIDPAETIEDGVVNYTVKVGISKPDPRVKSGLTANLEIETGRRDGVLVIPQVAVIEKDEGVFVRKIAGGEETEIKIVTGIRGADGMVEVVSGLAEGDLVANVGLKRK